MRRLADLHREGWASLQALDTYRRTEYARARSTDGRPTEDAAVSGEDVRPPLPEKVLAPSTSSGCTRSGAVGQTNRSTIRASACGPILRRPSFAQHDGRMFVYFEDYRTWNARARSLAELRATASARPRTVIAGPDTCRIPRSSSRGANGRRTGTGVDGAWRFGAPPFPGEWTSRASRGRSRCLRRDGVEDDGRWWMFVTLAWPRPRADEVSLFYADTPVGPWRPHRTIRSYPMPHTRGRRALVP